MGTGIYTIICVCLCVLHTLYRKNANTVQNIHGSPQTWLPNENDYKTTTFFFLEKIYGFGLTQI